MAPLRAMRNYIDVAAKILKSIGISKLPELPSEAQIDAKFEKCQN